MYGIRGSHHGSAYEVDHLISLELGGSNEVANLWPEAATPKPASTRRTPSRSVFTPRFARVG